MEIRAIRDVHRGEVALHPASDLPLAICFVVDHLSEWLAVEIATNAQRDPVLYLN
jgi:hypothetical protein